MKPRIILINLLLVAAIGASIWEGHAKWNEAQAVRHYTLEAKLPKITPPPSAPAPHPDAPAAAKYVDVATNDLFAKDRNPTVVIDTPKIEPPKIMPPLPVVYGVMGLPSGVKALMAEKAGASSQSVKVGDSIGAFKIAALDQQDVTFSWEDRQIHKKIDELMDRKGSETSGPAQAASVPAPPPMQMNAPPPPPTPPGAPFGVEVGVPGHSERACRPGDSSPADTVIGGYKKFMLATPFGVTCKWVAQ